ncbi:MAG: NAD-dependent epimerase/dehydratase family protein [Syntrophomonadaceae bacterium]|jgi:UDP-glucuronate 4-epimerase
MIEEYKQPDPDKTYLITGSAGFIGFFLVRKLLEKGCRVIGIDNMNDYYDVSLKESRHKLLTGYKRYSFAKADIADKPTVMALFQEHKPNIVVNLAAQAGVRYSIENPNAYIKSNIMGFYNILEGCRHNPVEHLVYASSSSVYGANTKVPFSIEDKADHPVSLYAATKKSNELMAYTYSYLYGIPSTGLRFFTVYGPMGRPDMAYFHFTRKILNNEPVQVFNYGNSYRDFTYIDDVVEAVTRVLCNPPAKKTNKEGFSEGVLHILYNIGNSRPEQVTNFIAALEKALTKAVGREIMARKEYLPLQPGDVIATYSDSTSLQRDFNFKPSTDIEEGLQRFAEWYVDYYQVK